MTEAKVCKAPGCDRPERGRRGWCLIHYTRMRECGALERPTKEEKLSAARARVEVAVGGKEIPGFPGFYATPDGRIFTMRWGRGLRHEPLQLRAQPDKGGYLQVRLAGVRKTVHRLVTLAFLGPMPAGLQVRHLDGVPSNNRLENLAYGTPKQNGHDKIAHGTNRAREKHPQSRWTDAEVNAAVRLYEAGGITQQAIAESYGTTQQVVSRWIWAARAGSRTRHGRGAA